MTLGTCVMGLKPKGSYLVGVLKWGGVDLCLGSKCTYLYVRVYTNEPADLGICQFCRRHVRVGTGHRRDNPPGGIAEVNVKATSKGYPPTL